MKKFIYLLSLFLVTASCNEDADDALTDFQPIEITFTEIAKGQLSGNGQEGILQSNLVITNDADWMNLINQMDSYNVISTSFTETTIDFESEMIIAVFDTIQPHSGYNIQIESAIETSENMTVNCHEEALDTGFAVINQPFHIVRIPITEKEIVFESI